MGRCFIYGAGAIPLGTACQNQNPNVTISNRNNIKFRGSHLFFGMCFMAPKCNVEEHITCHRYQATTNISKPVRTSKSAGHYKRFSSIYNGGDELDSGV